MQPCWCLFNLKDDVAYEPNLSPCEGDCKSARDPPTEVDGLPLHSCLPVFCGFFNLCATSRGHPLVVSEYDHT